MDEKEKQNQEKGFAGLLSMVSDVDAVIDGALKETPPVSVSQAPVDDLLPSPPPHTGQSLVGFSVWGVVVVLIVLGYTFFNNKPSQPVYSPKTTSRPVVPVIQPEAAQPLALNQPLTKQPQKLNPPVAVLPQKTSRPSERRPSVGLNNVLVTDQIRYCLAEKIRMDASEAALNSYNDSDVDRFNWYVSDYNSRCGEFRYRSGALESARRGVDPYRKQLQAEGKNRFVSSLPVAEQSSSSAKASKPARSKSDATVIVIQRSLNELGYSAGSADGIFGKKTRTAIQAFQRDQGIRQDGRPTAELLAQITLVKSQGAVRATTARALNQSTPPVQAPKPVRSIPDATVKAIQRRLNELGYNAGRADGLIGERTRLAIASFQKNSGLLVDGIVTQSLLQQILSTRTSPAKSSSLALSHSEKKKPQLMPLSRQGRAPDLSRLSRSEKQSIESACSTDKHLNGPAAYSRCLSAQLRALDQQGRAPDLSRLSRSEKQSIESACSTDKHLNGPAAYSRCLSAQLRALDQQGRAPDLSRLSRSEKQSIESACSTDKHLNGPAAYSRCLSAQLRALDQQGRAPDLSGLSRSEKQSIESVCSTDKHLNGPAAYSRCLSAQLRALDQQGRAPDLSGLSRSEKQAIESVCSTDKHLNGPAAYSRCLSRQLSKLRN